MLSISIILSAFIAVSLATAPLNITHWNRVLFISAHPDDIEAIAGGLVSELTAQKKQVFFVIVTNGDKGCASPTICRNLAPQDVAAVRRQEAFNAANVLGVPREQVFMLDYEDAMLTSYPEQQPRQDLVFYIRGLKPDVVLTFYPYPNFKLLPSQNWGDLGYHPDHQHAGKLALDATFDAGVGLLFPTSGPGWSVTEFYMWEFLEPTHYFALSDSDLNIKTQAFLQHKSQYDNADKIPPQMRLLAETVAANAKVSGLAEGYLAYW